MPLTCSAIGRSPTLLVPEDPAARALFELLGTVHAVEDEAQFTPASVIAAYYGWIYALMGEAITWCEGAGVPPAVSESSWATLSAPLGQNEGSAPRSKRADASERSPRRFEVMRMFGGFQ